MDHRIGVPSAIVQAVRELDEPYYTRDEVAKRLGVSPSTLAEWGEQDPALAPYGHALVGRRKVYLYTEADVVTLRAYQVLRYPIRANGLRTRRRGRPKMWNDLELKQRGGRHRRIAYLKDCARAAEEAGEEHRQLDLLAEAELIRRELDEQYRARFAEVTRPQRHDPDWLTTQMQA